VPEALRLIERQAVNYLFFAPTMTRDVLHHEAFASANLSRLLFWQSGTAPLPDDLREEVVRRVPHISFRITYGSTETGMVCALHHAQRNRGAGCVGRAAPSTHLRIVDDNGLDVARGEVGEIWCASPMVSPGYFDRDAANLFKLSSGSRWHASGDLGYLDAEGYLFLVGRKKDVIISGGENISADQVEDVLRQCPGVSDAAVIGIADEKWGESVLAFIVRQPGSQLTASDVEAHARGHLAGYKCPKRIEFLDVLPRTPIGKTAKSMLRSLISS
jgi:fatty-acyl-CoA synthase